MRVLVAVVIVLAIVAGIGGVAVWFGGFDVAARTKHSATVRWLFTTARDRSIAARSRGVVPPVLAAPVLQREGFAEYDELCAVCHGQPGAPPSAVRQGLNPPAPDLADEDVQHRYGDAELFWIVKNGIRMTGMPGFGETHDDETLWSIVAFVRHLPTLDAKQYAAMARGGDREAHEHHR